LAMRRAGPYQVQAAIAAVHAEALNADATDWREIAMLYGRLAAMTPSPVVDLNRAVAISNVEGAAAALDLVEGVAGKLAGYQPFHAARADLLRRLGHDVEAAAAYRVAIELSSNDAERRFLQDRLAALTV
ncbi:MAG TPA: hypothetical protein VJQ83_06255, partial [Tepidiformaceae bacterium]|nr:hypothetical protein [Tepidiformaceae bacterium]